MNKKLNRRSSKKIQKCKYIYKDISKDSTYTKIGGVPLKKEEFNFSAFYEKHKVYLPKNISPSSYFLS
jgi:hypothetical protein